jgi:hypothetical protein
MRYFLVPVARAVALGVVYLTYLQGYGGGAGFEGRDMPVPCRWC